MPPKQARNSDKVDRKKEEAERKAREEAEQDEQEKGERKEQEERDRIEAEERERQRAEEEVRFRHGTDRLNAMLQAQREHLEKWKLKYWETLQWEHYTSCSQLPDPSNEKSFNTYLTLCEEACDSERADIEVTLQDIKDYLFLCCEIEKLLFSDGLPDPTDTDSEWYKQSVHRLRRLVQSKLDSVTISFIREAEQHVDTETYNMRVEGGIEGLVYCLWGNVGKNPRLKDFSFKDHFKFTLEIPKPLLLADVAVRVIQLPFDLLSPLSQSHICKRSPPVTGVSNQSNDRDAPSNQGDVEVVDGEAGKEVDEGEMESGQLLQEQEQPAGSSVSVGAGVEEPSSVAVGEQDEDTEQTDVPQPLQSVPDENDDISDVDDGGDIELQANEVNLRAFQPACGPILFQLLEMPPQAKSVNNWTIKRATLPYLVTYPYPAEVPRPPPSTTDEETVAAPPTPTPGSTSWPPIPITMQLPDPFLFSEEPQLAQWDSDKKMWTTGGFRDVIYDLEEKTVSFQTFYFCPLALMVDRYANMPYISWTMLPFGFDHTRLIIEGGMVTITVDIKAHHSTLVGPTGEKVPTLSHIINKTMSARQLKQALSSVGVNFFPEPDADKYVSVTPKRHLVENSVYRNMSLASCGVAFQWSKWNSEAGRGKVVLRTALAPATGTDIDEDLLQWSTYVGGQKNYKLAITEDSSEFSLTMCEGSETHPSLFLGLEHDSTPSVKERFTKTSPLHNEAVMYWLTAVKMLTFS